MMEPRYQEVPSSESPIVEKDGIWARVIAGECMGVTSSIDTVIPITLVHVKMNAGTRLIQDFGSQLNGMIYVFGGKINLENKTQVKMSPITHGITASQQVRDGDLAILSDGTQAQIYSEKGAEFLILAGPELNEPIERYGPFVMNTKEEINQAFLDYRSGNFAR